MVDTLDNSFLDPANAGVPDVEPVSITSSIAPITATADPTADLKAPLAAFGGDLETAYFIAQGGIAAALADPSRPNAGARGGEVLGVPLVTSRNAPDGMLILADAAWIAFTEDATKADASSAGSVVMSDTGTGGSLTSLWAANLTALRVEKTANWAARPGAVAAISGIAW